MKDVLIFTPIIRPGGGPAGYAYNMLSASRKTKTRNSFRFIGHTFDGRDTSNPDTWPFLLKVESYLSARGFYCSWPKPTQELKLLSKTADAVILHGPVHPKLVHHLKQTVKTLIFMPHSPSTWADEYMMDYSSKKRKLSRKRYDYFRWAEHTCMAYADLLVFPSTGAANAYRSAYQDILSFKTIHYLPSGVDVEGETETNSNHATPIREPNSKLTVGFIGRYNNHKGYDLYCSAAQELASQSLRFISAGNGPLKSTPSVENLGWISDISGLLRSLDIIIIPNRIAYYDLLPLEAAHFGIPLVFTPAGGSVDQAKLLPDTIVAAGVDASSLNVAIKAAVDKKRTQPNWGHLNKFAYVDIFSAKAMLERWDAFLSAVL